MNQRGKRGEIPVSIPLPERDRTAFGVFFRRKERNLPNVHDFGPIISEWLAKHSAQPLQGIVVDHIQKGGLALKVVESEKLPNPTRDLHCPRGLDLSGESWFYECNSCVLIGPLDFFKRPRGGLWAALAAGRALASSLDGLFYDYGTHFFYKSRSYQADLPAQGTIAVGDHIKCLSSVNERGHGWITTTGMRRFGLPDLEIREAPPDITPRLGLVLNGVAQRLASDVMDLADSSPKPPRKLLMSPEFSVSSRDISMALGKGMEESPGRASDSTRVRIQYPGVSRPGNEPFMTLCKPAGFQEGHGVWLRDIFSKLVDMRSDQVVKLRGTEEERLAMEEAYRKAVARLPEVKERFQQRLKPGEYLLVKHAFPYGESEDTMELMWTAVNTWMGNRLQGQLASDPQDIRDLKAGDPVELDQSEIIDWVIHHPDGSEEGGYTTAVLKKFLKLE